ncbi:RNA pseudouridine synthase [Carboxydothermus islandicus]|uniref:Pseudouridine synthase n=1 Tax=Carboxydothermus islandicus TaxID=661089 RepID=A0A1L8D521_9THEO|nr:RluA family pseudouridine synthase [Carboxydothermus islandicus]GAV26270.1 RNA pseudouridine synthase [Carboxydothermus islandicus]
MEITLPVPSEFIGKTIFQFLKELGISKRQLRKLKLQEAVFLNNQPAPLNYQLKTTGNLVIKLPQVKLSSIQTPELPLQVLYEDNFLLVVNKPAGILAHPVKNHPAPSLQELTYSYYLKNNKVFEGYYPIYRLDRNTTGAMLIAKFSLIAELLNKSLRSKKIKKSYLALVEGQITKKSGLINLPLGLAEGSIIKRSITPEGKPACTKYETLKLFTSNTLLKVEILTGRTHQIRAHFAGIGHPLVGDDLYGSKTNIMNRQALHLYSLSFLHPVTGKEIKLISPLPDDFKEALITLKKASGEQF